MKALISIQIEADSPEKIQEKVLCPNCGSSADTSPKPPVNNLSGEFYS